MKDEMADDIDVLLREQFEGPVAADGFPDRVMDQLPAQRRRGKWPLAAGAFAGVAMCWFSLWSAPITQIGWQDWLSGKLSDSVIALFASAIGMAILAVTWSIAEADDRHDPSSRGYTR